ncbi:MAG: hypothetical protein RIR70_1781, partial [Pseudomonadota bacterium]
SVRAEWSGFRPHLAMQGLQLLDEAGRVALRLERVEADVGWMSLPTASLRLARLEVFAPGLSIRREVDGHIYVAGIKVDSGAGGSDISDWVLSQSSILIRGASIEWVDAKRGAPPLTLHDVNFRLDNSGSRHRFGLLARPPEALASRVDLRGDLKGRHLNDLSDWQGEVYAELEYADLAGWRAWVDYPLWLPHGSGSMRVWAGFDKARLTSVTTDLALRGVTVRLAEHLPVMDLEHLAGRLQVRLPRDAEGRYEIAAKRLMMSLRDGEGLVPFDFNTHWVPVSDRAPGRGEFSASGVDFASLTMLSRYLPLQAPVRDALERYAPSGRLSDVKLNWLLDDTGIKAYGIKSKFSSLGLASVGLAPGFEAMTGSIDANERGGSMMIDAQGAALSMPAVFPEARLPFDALSARLKWSIQDGLIDAQLQNLTLANADAAGQVAGRWRGRAGEKGEIDLTAQLTQAKPAAVWRYLPHTVGQHARDWVKTALKDGVCADARLKLKGAIKKFPFESPTDGTFSVSAKCQGVTLDYAPGWPQAQAIAGEVRFEGKRMQVRATSGTILGAQLGPVTVQIPDLIHHEEVLQLQGRAAGPSAEFVKFLNQSPLAEKLGGFTAALQASGAGALDLKLVIPLRHLADSSVEGEYQFKGNRLVFGEGIPAITEAAATLQFSKNALNLRAASGRILGAPFTLSGQTRPDGGFQAAAQGKLVPAEMRREIDLGAFDHLSGNAPWQAALTVKSGAVSLVVDSTLQGLASSLPAPFNKPAAEAMPFKLEVTGARQVRASLGRALGVNLLRKSEAGQGGFERGVIAVNEPANLPERGVLLTANLKAFDYNAWRRAFASSEPSGAGLPITAVAAKVGVATLWGQVFNDLQLQGSLNDSTWQMRVGSREASGEINYRTTGKGRVSARFKQLSIGELKAEEGAASSREASAESPAELPGLDVAVENFSLKGHALGKLELQAANRGTVWRMEKLAITNPDGSMTGEGQWRTTAKAPEPATQMNLKIDATNIGRLLERVGYGEAMRRGNGRLEAKLAWAGPPTNLDYASLNGEIKLEASNGQFNKLEPGVGRLLGVVSLQSLPRRITLDFRDVFSEGFAFDSISGSMRVNNGVMSSDELRIRGPAARVSMKGEVDLAAETQDLRVKVQPTLSESVAIGAAIANPVAGVATYLAQKVLRDPVEKIFAFEYAVTGTWADPKVVKLGNDDTPQN